jgi:hypothetical protein
MANDDRYSPPTRTRIEPPVHPTSPSSWLIRSNEAYIEALERARTSPAVIEELGEPVEPGFWVGGSVNSSGPSGEADLMFPITGPDGSGTVYLQATKSAGIWSFERLEVEVEKRSGRIDLLQPGVAH